MNGFLRLVFWDSLSPEPIDEEGNNVPSSIPMIGIKWLGHVCRYDVFVVSGAQWELTCKRKRPDFLYHPQARLGTQRRRPCTGTGYVN